MCAVVFIFILFLYYIFQCVAVIIYHYQESRPTLRPSISLRRAVNYYYSQMCSKLGIYQNPSDNHTPQHDLPPVSVVFISDISQRVFY